MAATVKEHKTEIPFEEVKADFVVVGGGMAGICAAVAAARAGVDTVIVQDRPMFGGNASSEIRMWICGAHGADNKETGILEELLLENLYYNPTLKFNVWDDVMYSFVWRQPNLRLFLNCAVHAVETVDGTIKAVTGWHMQRQTEIRFTGKFFADCSGDSVLRYSGAEYRWGRESRDEFNESHAPEVADKKTMGNSIMIQLRKVKQHHPFRAPAWAYHYTDETAPKRPLTPTGHNFWWLEFGGVKDTIADADAISHELLKIAYGTWEYIKNHPDGRGREWELDWIGSLPGKRENVRYVGDHVLSQTEVEAGGPFADAVCHGGWSMDDHNPEAINFPGAPTIFHPAPSPYNIPYRCLYSRNVTNLFFAGRNASATHMAMSSTRVMATAATMGQAVGTAAAIALREHTTPRGVYEKHLHELQQTLLRHDQWIPNCPREVSPLALRGTVSHEVLRNGIDRAQGKTTNALDLPAGGSCEYRFATPETIGGARLVFDSNLADDKRMRCIDDGDVYHEMPATLARSYVIEAEVDGRWVALATVAENLRRYIEHAWEPVRATALRLTVAASWGGAPARVFDFEPE